MVAMQLARGIEMTVIIDQTRWEGGRINQVLDLNDDSISFMNAETAETLYRVDSSGYLTNSCENQIGKFLLRERQWLLIIDDEVFAEGPKDGLFKLPEFELVAIVKLLKSI